MAWRWIPQAIETGVVTDPRDLVRNQAEFAGEFNGRLDRDNVTTANVTADRVQAKALVEAGELILEAADVQAIPAHQTRGWIAVTALTDTITVTDGDLIVDADVNTQWDMSALPNPRGNEKHILRLLVGGIPIAHSGWSHINRTMTTVSLTGSLSVVTGPVAVSVEISLWADPWYNLTALNNGSNIGNTFLFNYYETLHPLSILAGRLVWVNRKR